MNQPAMPSDLPPVAGDVYPYAVTPEEALTLLRVAPDAGLTNDEAAKRSRQFGPNSIERAGGRSVSQILLAQFASIVVWLLIAAALVALFTGSTIEAAAIVVVLLLNASIGFAIEWQAGRALEALRRAASTTARVRRAGREAIIDASALVPGDVVVIAAGDRVPADSRLIEAASLRADESTLTGESLPVDKAVSQVDVATPLAERRSMLFLGTSVVAGKALAVVTATGKNSEIGKIGVLLRQTPDKKTPLERRLADLGKRLVYVVLGIAALVMLAGLARGADWYFMARVAISLAVAAVPEGLPAVTTLILALGVLRMARQSALVRHLSAVETLGSTTVICTDKTGTLTENRMTAQEIFLAENRTVKPDAGRHANAGDPNLTRLLRVASLCNDAVFHNAEDEQDIGDPTETALLSVVEKLGFSVGAERAKYQKLNEIPFEAATQRMVTVIADDTGRTTALIKGAPAVVLGSCTHFLAADGTAKALDDEDRTEFARVNEEMAGRALRVLGFADKALRGDDLNDLDSGYTFLGFIGLEDPPRAEAGAAISNARAAGIRVVMLTGDQVLTAQAIARRLNISEGADIVAMHSRDLIDADSTGLAEMAGRAHVFARVTPEDKLRIVEALQAAGEIVAVTGDGINDAPALKQAHIGVAMGKRGTDVAKEAADIVLTDDNFSTIVTAVESGRTIYANIIKFVHLMFSHNLGEVLVIFGAIIMGLPLPLFPLQILWVNLVTDIFPALALAVEPSTKETMLRPPRPARETLLSARFMYLIGWQGAMLAAIVLAAYYWALSTYGEGEHARTVALMSLISVQLGHLLNCRSRTRSAVDGLFRNPYIFAAIGVVVLLQVLALFLPPLSAVLGLATPNWADTGMVAAAFVAPIAIVETIKFFSRKPALV